MVSGSGETRRRARAPAAVLSRLSGAHRTGDSDGLLRYYLQQARGRWKTAGESGRICFLSKQKSQAIKKQRKQRTEGASHARWSAGNCWGASSERDSGRRGARGRRDSGQKVRAPRTASSGLAHPGQGGDGGTPAPARWVPEDANRGGGFFHGYSARGRQLDLTAAAKRPFCWFVFTPVLRGPQHAGRNGSKNPQRERAEKRGKEG